MRRTLDVICFQHNNRWLFFVFPTPYYSNLTRVCFACVGQTAVKGEVAIAVATAQRRPSARTPLESRSTSSLGALQGPGLAVIIVSVTMRRAQCISASSDKQWSFTKTRRSLRQLVKSMLRVSRLIKPSSLSSDTVSIVPHRLSTARWLEWNAHQSESWAGLMIPWAAY